MEAIEQVQPGVVLAAFQNAFNPKSIPWPDERVTALKRMWEAGDSASTIANVLGGVSRNAVLGKAWRLGLDGRKVIKPLAGKGPKGTSLNKSGTRPVFSKKRSHKKQGPRTRAESLREKEQRLVRALQRKDELEQIEVVELTIEQEQRAVSFFDLGRSHCRWPFGDPRDFSNMKFCGASKTNGEYCAEHHKAAFEPA